MFHWPLILLSFAIAPIFILLGLRGYVYLVTGKFRYHDPAKVPETPVAIILGAGIWQDGTPTPMLADRIAAGVELYKLGKVSQLLMSGDRSSDDYDEVTAMQRYAEKLGIPTEAIILDYAGFSTYETCDRAQAIFGIQQYSSPKIFICRVRFILGVN